MTQELEFYLSVAAILISFGSAIWQYRSQRQTRTETLMVHNLNAMANLERSLENAPKAFEFHGVRLSDIEAAGFTPGELAYLTSNFTIGGIYHRLNEPNNTAAFPPESYRHMLCSNSRVKDAWPLIEKMLTKSTYKMRLINTFEAIYGSSKASNF